MLHVHGKCWMNLILFFKVFVNESNTEKWLVCPREFLRRGKVLPHVQEFKPRLREFLGPIRTNVFCWNCTDIVKIQEQEGRLFVASPFSCAWELNDNSCLFILKSYTVSSYNVIIYTSNRRSRNLCSACAIMSRRRRSSDFVGKKTGKNHGASIAGMGCYKTLLNPTGPSEM